MKVRLLFFAVLRDIAGKGEEVRELPEGTRVMVVTGYGEPFVTRARQAGADVVFTKPVEWSRILDYLERPDLAASA